MLVHQHISAQQGISLNEQGLIKHVYRSSTPIVNSPQKKDVGTEAQGLLVNEMVKHKTRNLMFSGTQSPLL